MDAAMTHGQVTGWLRGGGRGDVLAVEPSYGTFGGLFDASGYAAWSAGAAPPGSATWTMCSPSTASPTRRTASGC